MHNAAETGEGVDGQEQALLLQIQNNSSLEENIIMKFEKLLSPGKIGTMELKNRFVVPSMGTNFGNYEGFVTDRMIEYYRARALGGFGLIIIEVTAVDPHGKAVLNEVGLWKDE